MNAAVIRCHQCRYSAMTYLCPLCDAEIHNDHPLHDREYWNGHYFSFIPPTQYPCPTTGNLIDIGKYVGKIYYSMLATLSGTVFYHTESSLSMH